MHVFEIAVPERDGTRKLFHRSVEIARARVTAREIVVHHVVLRAQLGKMKIQLQSFLSASHTGVVMGEGLQAVDVIPVPLQNPIEKVYLKLQLFSVFFPHTIILQN